MDIDILKVILKEDILTYIGFYKYVITIFGCFYILYSKFANGPAKVMRIIWGSMLTIALIGYYIIVMYNKLTLKYLSLIILVPLVFYCIMRIKQNINEKTFTESPSDRVSNILVVILNFMFISSETIDIIGLIFDTIYYSSFF